MQRGGGLATVKREYRYDGGEVSEDERWSRDLVITQISEDGAWLVGHGSKEVQVLDASTGNTVFAHTWGTLDNSVRIHVGVANNAKLADRLDRRNPHGRSF